MMATSPGPNSISVPVVHTDALAARDKDLDVTSLAALSADGWLDVR
jgi:hypothetical protein